VEQLWSYTGEVEEEMEESLYFSYNSTSVIGLREMETPDGVIVRTTIRDCTGKYAWESKLLYTTRNDINLDK
jgi:hypothetical protein